MHRLACFAVLAAVTAVAACQQPAPAPKMDAPPAAVVTAPVPNAEWAKSFEGWTWGEVKGGGVSIWGFSRADDKLIFDAAVPGFVRETTGPNAGKITVVQLFTKAADAPVDAVLPAVRAASKGGAACVFEQIKDSPAGHFQLMPVDAARKAYDAAISGKGKDGDNLLPCGPLGPSEAGMRVIRAVPGAPTLVAVIHMPSDIPTFDDDTLKAAP